MAQEIIISDEGVSAKQTTVSSVTIEGFDPGSGPDPDPTSFWVEGATSNDIINTNTGSVTITDQLVSKYYRTRWSATDGGGYLSSAEGDWLELQGTNFAGGSPKRISINPRGANILLGTTADDNTHKVQIQGNAAIVGTLTASGTVSGATATDANHLVTKAQFDAAITAVTPAASTLVTPIVYADSYTDGFTAFNVDGFNHDSAIWKILNDHSFSNVHIILSKKAYLPIMQDTRLLTLQNVTIEGLNAPSYKQNLVGLENGSIIQGCLVVNIPSSNCVYKNFGVDAGKDVTDTYYAGAGIEGFLHSYLAPDAALPWGHNMVFENITTLLRDPDAQKHGFLIERVNGATMNNIRACFGTHGIALKGRYIKVGSMEVYGSGGNYVVIKSDLINATVTNTGNISIDYTYADIMPPEVTTSWVTIPKPNLGFRVEVNTDMDNIQLGRIVVKNAGTTALGLDVRTGAKLERITAQSCEFSDCYGGLVRYGVGEVSYANFDYIHGHNVRDFLTDIEGGTGADKNWTIGTLSNSGIQCSYGIYLRDGVTVHVGTFIAGNLLNAIQIVGGSKLRIGAYTPVLVTNMYDTGSELALEMGVQMSTGTTAPTSTPYRVGLQYIDTSAKKLYVSTGIASSADWTILN